MGDGTERKSNAHPPACGTAHPRHLRKVVPFLLAESWASFAEGKRLGLERSEAFAWLDFFGEEAPHLHASHREVSAALGKYGMSLPSEAQLEYVLRCDRAEATYVLSGMDVEEVRDNLDSSKVEPHEAFLLQIDTQRMRYERVHDAEKIVERFKNTPAICEQNTDPRKTTPNAWGFYGLLSNLGEWCSDRYRASYRRGMEFAHALNGTPLYEADEAYAIRGPASRYWRGERNAHLLSENDRRGQSIHYRTITARGSTIGPSPRVTFRPAINLFT